MAPKNDLRRYIDRLAAQRAAAALRDADDDDRTTDTQVIVIRERMVSVADNDSKIEKAAGAIATIIKAVRDPYALGALVVLAGCFVAWLAWR